MKRILLLVCAIVIIRSTALMVLHSTGPGFAAGSQAVNSVLIRQMMQPLIDFLDSADYAEQVSWDEHLVLIYRLAAGRDPDLSEFFVLKTLHEQIELSHSAVLSFALRDGGLRPDLDRCRTFLERINISDFIVDESIRKLARQLAAEPRWKVLYQLRGGAEAGAVTAPESLQQQLKAPAPYVQYNTYFGFLHAHSNLSDGEGSPYEAYTYARDQGALDFFALSDHGELLDIWPWEEEWKELKEAAQNTYAPCSFVTLWGFEWSNPVYGHITVLNTNDFTDSISRYSVNELYKWIMDRSQSFGHYNHPGDYDDFNNEFEHLEPFPGVVAQMVGIENWNGNDSFDKYYYSGGWSSDALSYWDEGNRKGWYLGSLGSQDNHDRNWGTMNPARTAVLAEDLTRESIIEAYRQRRFYATEDKDLHLDFRCQGYPMGSQLSGVHRVFEITAWDGSGDTFQEVRLYRDGFLLLTKAVTGDEIQIVLSDRSYRGNAAYYYAVVRQNDDNDGNGGNDEAISSPIWIDSVLPRTKAMPWIPVLLLAEPD